MTQKGEKHFTSSIYIFHDAGEEWKLLLVHHRKFNKWMIPGGHIDFGENPVEAVLREAYEETETRPKLISFIHKEFIGADSKWLLPPEYLFEQLIPPHGDDEEHYHLDCAYVGVTDSDSISRSDRESHDIAWFSEGEVEEHEQMFPGTKKIALDIFGKLNVNAVVSYKE
jgi:8-oxo-dGTP pyrophosphatase MutT (NUDIX family)